MKKKKNDDDDDDIVYLLLLDLAGFEAHCRHRTAQ